MSSIALHLDCRRARVLRRALDNWHFWRAGESIDDDDRTAAELEVDVDFLLERLGCREEVNPDYTV